MFITFKKNFLVIAFFQQKQVQIYDCRNHPVIYSMAVIISKTVDFYLFLLISFEKNAILLLIATLYKY